MALISEAALLVKGGPDEGSTIPITQPLTRLGRAPFNDVVVDDSAVSRHHADIHADPDGYRISDISSRNGTFVNGEKIGTEPRRLRNLARIELGGTDTPMYWIFLESQATVEVSDAFPG